MAETEKRRLKVKGEDEIGRLCGRVVRLLVRRVALR